MANYRAIAAASAAIKGLLRDRFPSAELGGPLNIELYQAKDFTNPMKDGIAVCLWRVAPNISRRATGTRTDIMGRKFKPSLPIDLFYLLVPYAETAERQLRLLGWMLRAMEDLGPLVASQLNHFLAESDIFAEAESLDMVNDPMSIADQLTLWDRIKTMPPSATYAMRLLMLDSDQRIEEFPLVVERELDVGVLA
jgi:Pvc16 N-terminal domain